MDTLEWGTTDRPADAPLVGRVPRWLGPPISAWLAGAAVVLGILAEVLPWASVSHSAAPGRTTDVSLYGVSTITVLAFYLSWLALLATTGLVLAGRPAVRRAAAGVALGFAGAVAMTLAGIIQSIVVSGGIPEIAVSESDSSTSSASLGLGVFAACLGTGLLIAAVLLGVRRRAPTGVSPAAALGLYEEPVDLTVTRASTVDETLMRRNDSGLGRYRREPGKAAG